MRKFLFLIFSKRSLLIPKAKSFFSLIFFLALVNYSQIVFADEILLAAAASSNPTSYIENGQQTGILVDVINEAFRRTAYTVEIHLMPWARCLEEVKYGHVDGIFSVFKTEERQEFLTYADEVLITQVVAFFVSVDSTISFDGDLRKLADKSIGIVNQTSYGARFDAALREGLFKNVDPAHNSRSNVQKLLAGRVELIPSYQHVVLRTAKELGASDKIRQLSPDLEAIPSYLAFTQTRDFTTVIADFNKALQSMKEDGSYEKIFQKYLDSF